MYEEWYRAIVRHFVWREDKKAKETILWIKNLDCLPARPHHEYMKLLKKTAKIFIFGLILFAISIVYRVFRDKNQDNSLGLSDVKADAATGPTTGTACSSGCASGCGSGSGDS